MFPVDWNSPSFQAIVHYQEPPPDGKRTGRYISPQGNEPDVLVDVHHLQETTIHNARTVREVHQVQDCGRGVFKVQQWRGRRKGQERMIKSFSFQLLSCLCLSIRNKLLGTCGQEKQAKSCYRKKDDNMSTKIFKSFLDQVFLFMSHKDFAVKQTC